MSAAIIGAPPDQLRRQELASFLRSRRERIRPEQVGLGIGRRRRTPGLRREEVAHLAGVGVTWYTWLEQGRAINASGLVLDAISRALMLDRDERGHLFTLAGIAATPPRAGSDAVSPAMRNVLGQVEPFPACIQNARYDLLAYNAAYGRLVADLDTVPDEDRNSLWLMFTDPAWRTGLPDWDTVSARMVAQFRVLLAEHMAEPGWTALFRRLSAASPDFVRVWEQHGVTETQSVQKRFRNPAVGELTFDLAVTWLAPRHGTRLLVYAPSDVRTRQRLDELMAHGA